MIQDIIIFILILLVIYYISKKSSEHFTVPNVEDLDSYIKTNIDENYQNKINSIDIILNFIQENSKNNNNFVINTNTPITVKEINSGKFKIDGIQKFKNLRIKGDLNLHGGLNINYDEGKNTVEIIPRYMIVAWSNNFYKRITILPENLENGIIEGVNDRKLEAIILDIPRGWVLCDGRSYIIENGNPIVSQLENSIKTPDLRNRFVIGVSPDEYSYTDQEAVLKNTPANQIETVYISKYEFGQNYGNHTYSLIKEDLPHHWHMFTTTKPIYLKDLDKTTYPDADYLKQLYTERQSDGSPMPSDYKISTGLSNEGTGSGLGWNRLDLNKKVTYVETENTGSKPAASFNTVQANMSFFYIMKI